MPTVGRLKKRPDFLEVAAARVKWVTPGLILQARRRSEARGGERTTGPDGVGGALPDVRVGFTVSRKVGNAVQRNRARRRLRAAAGEVLPEFGRAGTDYVLIGRKTTLERPYAALLQDLREALKSLEGKRRAARESSKGA